MDDEAKVVLPIDQGLDADLADQLAYLESFNKHHFRPNTYLHKWWGRRCGTTFRLILKGLVDDPAAQSYYAPGGLEGKVILDPMIGGGTTLHEAIRMGANVVGADIDPIPVLQARATLTDLPLSRLGVGFERFHAAVSASIDELFMTDCPECDRWTPFRFALYGLRRRCKCREVVVVDSLTIRQEPDGRLLQLCPACGSLDHLGQHVCSRVGPAMIVAKQERACAECGEHFRDIRDVPYYKRYRLLALSGHCPAHGLFFRPPTLRDLERLAEADARRPQLPFDHTAFQVNGGDKSIQLRRRGIISYLDLFSSRQLCYLSDAITNLPDDDLALRQKLALLVSTSLEFNSMLCGYKGVARRRAGAVRHAFSHHGYAFPYTALEANPVYPQAVSGSLRKLYQTRLERARRWAVAPRERLVNHDEAEFVTIDGEHDSGHEIHTATELASGQRRFLLLQQSAVSLPLPDRSVDAVVTDPPYYDSIQYTDLAEYFRVWLRCMLPDVADWDYDSTAVAVNSERNGQDDGYLATLSAIFLESGRVLRPGSGRLIFTYHHWRPRAWATLTIALRRAGYRLLTYDVVHAEHPMSVHINNMKALTHDAILVLAQEGQGTTLNWKSPPLPLPRQSRDFTAGCAALLGWSLAQPHVSDVMTYRMWEGAVSGRR